MRKIIKFLGVFLISQMAILLPSCESQAIDKGDDGVKEDIDFGTVEFPKINIYKEFDQFLIRPILSNPEVSSTEVFDYEAEDESVAYVDDGQIFYMGNGTTKIEAKSEHLEGSFYVTCGDLAGDYSDIAMKAKAARNNFALNGSKTGSTLFLGDSFFEFWKDKTNIDIPFSEVFDGYDVVNIGISRTQSVHWRAFQETVVKQYQPENVVINLGINDIDDGGFSGEECYSNLKTYIEDIHFDFPEAKIYRFTLTRCSGVFASKRNLYQKNNDLLKAFAEKNSYFEVLDVAKEYGDDYASLEQDGLHPNQAGYDIFARLIFDNLPLKKL